jgi:hypothetical protein
MINILIVEDELEQLPFAYAGLIPSVSIDTSTFHIRELVKASKKYYKVETAKSIEIALEKLKKFIPDIVIIDIHLNSTSPYKIGGKELNTGIDLYRYLEDSYEKILYSTRYSSYYKELSQDESFNFIPKSTSSVGYENLSYKISFYLKNVARKILSSALPIEISRIESDIKTKDFHSIKNYPYTFGKRTINLESLLTFCSFPYTSGPIIELDFLSPANELLNLIQLKDTRFGSKWRSEWLDETFQTALANYHASPFLNTNEKEVNNSVIKILTLLEENVSMESALRFQGCIYGEFRLTEYNISDIGSDKFQDKFLNVLIIRRLLIGIELFNRNNIDSKILVFKTNFKHLLNRFITEIIKGLKGRNENYSPGDLSQFALQLNLGFKINHKDTFKREILDIDKYVLFDCEKEWLNSTAFSDQFEFMKRFTS